MSNKNQVTQITNMQDDFAQWYTDIVKKAELIEYTSIKGCMVLRPNGYAIWENIQKNLDEIFKQTNHENVYMPMFIPESLLKKEADHVEGFAPEVAWVTHSGDDKLAERMCVRPTSETLFCEHYANIIQSHRDLPKLYNQWCSVVRMEKTTRPFLRSSEFLWQEGHTVHETEEEAQQETEQMLNVYADFCRDFLAIPVLKGRKTDKEKFAGALHTYTIEALMRDGKSLQSGTSHNFGDGFAKAFGIQYTNKENKLAYPFQTSWGVSTRLIGALIMVHSDNNGLVLPPKIAPTQLVVIPVMQKKEGVIEKATEIQQRLSKVARTKIDITDKSPGWKYSEYEMKGIPLRLEIGPKDIEANKCILVRRDNSTKIEVSLDDLEETVTQLLEDIQQSLLANATQYKEDNTHSATDWETFNTLADGTTGFIKAMWCEDLACEEKIKEEVGLSSRCMPFEQEQLSDTCICCGKPATQMVVWGKAY